MSGGAAGGFSAFSIANEVRMKRTQYDGAFLICEGAGDSRFIRRFIDEKNCRIIVARAKSIVLEAIEILDDSKVPGCCAIVDADFDRQLGVQYRSHNVIATNHHDLDAVLFFSPALEKILYEYGSEGKIAAFQQMAGITLREAIIQSALHIGALRFVSQRDGLALKFEGLKFSEFLDRTTGEVNRLQLVTSVKNLSQRHDFGSQDLVALCDEVLGAALPVGDMCNGHDIAETVAFLLRKAAGSAPASTMTGEFIGSQLRLSYERPWFTDGSMRLAISQWEAANGPYVILSP